MTLQEGEMVAVPKDVEHAPKAEEDVEVLVMGINTTSNKEGGKPALVFILGRCSRED